MKYNSDYCHHNTEFSIIVYTINNIFLFSISLAKKSDFPKMKKIIKKLGSMRLMRESGNPL